MKETHYEDHSMVMVSLHNVSATGIPLFGSAVKHRNVVALSISKASVKRNLSSDWFHSEEEIIEVFLSATQFADLLCKMNTSGTPATLHWYEGKYYEYPEIYEKAQQFKDETEESLKDTLSALRKATRNF